jgi:uncharacterized membrane protein YeaQ/YmgE (transglycosylase-associated protein family)
MSIIGWIVLGAIAGWLASIITKRNAQMGCIANIVVGVIGGLLGGWIMSFFGVQGVTGLNIPSLIVALIGAVVLLFIWNLIQGRRAV